MAGTDVISHIKYLSLTTIPSFVIALLIFSGVSLYHGSIDSGIVMDGQIQMNLKEIYNLSPWLFLIPVLVIVLIAKKMPAIPALTIGVVGGIVSMLVFQDEQFGLNQGWAVLYRNIHDVVLTDYVPAGVGGSMEELLATSGMQGMLSTIWLILSAMFFGGIMEACGFLSILTNAMLKSAESDAAVFTATAASAVVVNVSASDQYLSIVIPGRMFAGSFAERGLAPENLSRTLEDAGTVTSVLIPWNTCGAYQSRVLGVDAFSYLPYAFFNLLSPLMTLIFAWFKIKIKRK